MTAEEAEALGRYIRNRRTEQNLSTRELADQAGVDMATIVRLEQGAFRYPRRQTLEAVAKGLGAEISDLLSLANSTASLDLPTFAPYLRTKYRDLPAPALKELEQSFRRVTERYGYAPGGPKPGEDEQP